MNNNPNVEIIHRSGDEISHPNCLVVAPYQQTPNSRKLLATIEHFRTNDDPAGFPWKILPVTEQGLPLKEAMDLALSYAESNGVPAILVNQHDFSTEAERQQTDTTVVKIRA